MKHTADQTVDCGTDITDAYILFEILKQKTTIKLFEGAEEEVQQVDLLLPPNINPVPRTTQIHHFQVIKPAQISVQDISCFCKAPLSCCCLDARVISFPMFPMLVNDHHATKNLSEQPSVATQVPFRHLN